MILRGDPWMGGDRSWRVRGPEGATGWVANTDAGGDGERLASRETDERQADAVEVARCEAGVDRINHACQRLHPAVLPLSE